MKYINRQFIKDLSKTDIKTINIMIHNIKNDDSFCYALSCRGCIFNQHRNMYGVDCCNGFKSSLLDCKKDKMLFIKDLEDLKHFIIFPNGYKKFVGR